MNWKNTASIKKLKWHLNTRMCFMHELKKLVYNCFEKLPMCSEKPRILANNIPEHPANIVIKNCPTQGKHCHSLLNHLVHDNPETKHWIPKNNNLGAWIIYMILLAMTALLSLPFVISQRFNKSRITVTRKRFSCWPYIFIMLTEAHHKKWCTKITNLNGTRRYLDTQHNQVGTALRLNEQIKSLLILLQAEAHISVKWHANNFEIHCWQGITFHTSQSD